MPKKTFECAQAVGAIFITQVKGNQESLKKQVAHGCQVYKPTACYEEALEKGHGRIEQRKYEVFKALPILEKWQKEWPYIQEVIKVTRYRQENRKSKPTLAVHYYVSNRALKAEKYAHFIREHWWIENKVNHVKDVAFLEDRTTKHCNPYVYSTCIDFALNIMKMLKSENIKNSLFENSMSINKFYEKIKKLL